MMNQQKEISLSDYVNAKRNQIVIAYDQAKEIALRNYDDASKKLIESMSINEQLRKQIPAKKPDGIPQKVEPVKSENKKADSIQKKKK